MVIDAFRARKWAVIDIGNVTRILRDKANGGRNDSDIWRSLAFVSGDAVHFKFPIYRAFNELTFSSICDETVG